MRKNIEKLNNNWKYFFKKYIIKNDYTVDEVEPDFFLPPLVALIIITFFKNQQKEKNKTNILDDIALRIFFAASDWSFACTLKYIFKTIH